MNTFVRLTQAVLLLAVVATVAFGQTPIMRSKASANWELVSNWERSTDGGSTWATATAQPVAADSVVIPTGHTILITGSPRNVKSLYVSAGATLRADTNSGAVQPTSTIRYIRVNGGVVHVDGVFGNATDSLNVLSLEAYGSFTITGSGIIKVCRIRPGSSQSNLTVTFDADVELTYIGGSGTGGSALYSSNSSNDNITFTVNAGRTLSGVVNANFATASSTGSDGAANTVFNVYGTMNMRGGILSLRAAAGKTAALNVASTGVVSVGKDFLPTGTTGVLSSVVVDGQMTVGTMPGRGSDFTNPNQYVSGVGTYVVPAQSWIKIGAPDGLSASTGPLRTNVVTLDPGARYEYVGTAAQTTQNLPATVAGLTINNPAGVTLALPVSIDSALVLTSGKLDASAHLLTLGPLATATRGSGYVDGTLRKEALSSAFTFPVGTNAGYSPLVITPIADTGNVDVVATLGVIPFAPPNVDGLGVWWQVSAPDITAANIGFMYPSAVVTGNENSYTAARNTGGPTAWTLYKTLAVPASDSAGVNNVPPDGAWTLVPRFDDPQSLQVANAGVMTLDGRLNEQVWQNAPTLLFSLDALLNKLPGDQTPTGEVDVKNPFNDAGTDYFVPTTTINHARVKFVRKGMKLYVGIESDDKSICKFDWEGDGMFLKVKSAAGQDREYKLYWQNIDSATVNTIRYEEQVVSSGAGAGYLPAGSTVNDTNDVDQGYSAELMIDLEALGYTAPLSTVEMMLAVFDPNGFQHPMNSWDHTIGSFYKSWWGSEWGGVYRTLEFTPEPFDDPAALTVKNSGKITLDGQLNEADWNGAPTLLFGLGTHLKKSAGEQTVTGGVDVKNPFNDAGSLYYVPTVDTALAKVKFLRKGTNLYIGITSDDKSICKFDWEGDGMFLKVKSALGQDREYKLYWQNIDSATANTIRYEEQVVGSGAGAGYLPTGSTVNDTTNVDNGYSAELMIDLAVLGYTAPLTSVQMSLAVFEPNGFQHPMNSWDHTIGSFYKSWWGSEWGGRYGTLNFTVEQFDDPDSLKPQATAIEMNLDGKLDEADWATAPALVYGMGSHLAKQAGEYTVTTGVDVKNPFNDAGTLYYVPHTDSTVTRVKFLQKGLNLYIGIDSDDKSICKFDWEGDGMFLKFQTAAGQD
ncbi:MAG: G8 domain-containing protein, partial [Bacteroidetes bacterium]|nr:G8 domain-containing protein [Bacteroidota bacterium]